MNAMAMRPLDVVRAGVPFAVLIIFVTLTVVPLRLPEIAAWAPNWPVMILFYYAVKRPDLMAPWMVFIAGLAGDILSGGQLGVTALSFLLAREAAAALAAFLLGRNVLFHWLGFAVIMTTAQVVGVVLSAMLTGTLIAPGTTLYQIITTALVYPVMALALSLLTRALFVERRDG